MPIQADHQTSVSTPLLWGKGHSVGRRKNTQRKQSQFEPDPQGFHSSNLGADPAPDRVVMATEQRGNPASHPAQTLAPPSKATPPTKVVVART